MISANQKLKAEYFQSLHQADGILLLANAWDAMSAKIFEKGGAKAIGTTSAGIANCLGFPDGEKIPKSLFLMMVDRIISSVNVPVTVDIEAGFGQTVEEICEMVDQVIGLGAVGINLEDSDFTTKQPRLVSIENQSVKIKAIRKLVDTRDFPLFINARTDVYWHRDLYDDTQRYDETIKRLIAYHEAGANGGFIPGLADKALIQKICTTISLPINILGGAWILSFDELKLLGVKRISTGSGPFRTAAAFLTQMTSEIVSEKNFQSLRTGIPYDEMNHLFESRKTNEELYSSASTDFNCLSN